MICMQLDGKFERKFRCKKWPILRKNDQLHTDQLLLHADQLFEMPKIVKNRPKRAQNGLKTAFLLHVDQLFENREIRVDLYATTPIYYEKYI